MPDGDGVAASPAADVIDATEPHPGVVGASEDHLSEPPWFRRRPALALAVALAALVALIAFAALAGNDPQAPEEAATTGTDAADPTVSGPSATDDTARDTTAAPPPTVAASTLGELADRLAADPDSYGEKGPDLLTKLQEVQREKPDKQAEKATKVLEEIDKWVAEGKLDPDVANDARAVLHSIADS